MTSDPRARALAVVRRALQLPSQVELFVAMQYLGMLRDDALAPLRDDDAAAVTLARVMTVPPAPRPAAVQAAVQAVARVDPAPVVSWPRRRTAFAQDGLFAKWMEGSIPWSPAVMNWDDDDPRVEQMRELGEHE